MFQNYQLFAKTMSCSADIFWLLQDVPLILADTFNQDTVDAAVKQTRVVIACAGPFAKIGTPVVDACVRLGSHYVDITGVWPVFTALSTLALKDTFILMFAAASSLALWIIDMDITAIVQAKFLGLRASLRHITNAHSRRVSRLCPAAALIASPATWAHSW